MEFGRKADLEQHVLHHVAAVRTIELERRALEQHVVEAPCLRRQHGRVAHLAGPRDQREAHRTRRCVAGRPALARAGVRRMAIRAQALAIHPRERHGVDDLVARQPEHARDDGRRRYLDEHDVVETDAIEAVLQRDDALDLVRLDHAGQHVLNGQRRAPGGNRIARQPVGRHQDAAEIVGWVSPFGREPRIVEVEPANHRAEAERGLNGIELIRRSRHLGPVGHDRAGHDRSEQLRARRIRQRFEAAAQRVEQAVMRGLVSLGAGDLELRYVIGDVAQHLVGLGTYVGYVSGHWKGGFQARRSIGTNARLSGPV